MIERTSALPFPLGRRLGAHLGLKAALTVFLPVLFCAGYFSLQRFTLFEPHRLSLSWIDRAIGFDPGWIYVYQSIYLFMPVAPWLASRREDLVRYARGFAWLSGTSFLVFLCYPVAGPRPDSADAVPAAYAWLVRYEGTLNAFPSLHAGLTAYSLLFGYRVLAEGVSRGAQWVLALAALGWGGAILFATLATKQHYAVDLPAGVGLAVLFHGLAWRGARPVGPIEEKRS